MNNIGLCQLKNDNNISIGDFSNNEENIYPGINGDSAATFEPDNTDVENAELPAESDYVFTHRGKKYFYGITKNSNEVIAAIDTEGALIPLYNGAGKYSFSDRSNTLRFKAKNVESFEEIENDGIKGVKVSYSYESDCRFVRAIYTTYLFKEYTLSAEACISCEGFAEGLVNKKCFLLREHYGARELYQKRVSYYWIYPDDNDYVYKDADALVLSEKYGDILAYTFIRDENCSKKIDIRELSDRHLPLEIANDFSDIDYKYKTEIVFERGEDAAYKALFKSRGADFAAGVTSVEKNGNSTFFMGKELKLNLNVTAITDRNICYNVSYNIMNYYNEKVSSGIFYNNNLLAGKSANRRINLKLDKYGMYYLNFHVTTDGYTHSESYPFAMLEDTEIKYRKTNPFGVCAPHINCREEADSTAELLDKIGISSVRLDKQFKYFYLSDKLKEHGVTRQSIGIAQNLNPDDVDGYMKRVEELAADWMDRVEVFFMANECDKYCKNNYDKSIKFINDVFYPSTFKPAYDFFKKNYPDRINDIVWQSNCHCSTEWMEAYHETGIWDKSGMIDIHSYSCPSGPDKVFSNQLSNMFANLFSNEYAAVRWKRLKRRYGEKKMIVGEAGYTTTVSDKKQIDIRTQADFNVRIALFFLEAGAKLLNYYCLYDRTSKYVGSSNWEQMYFGACHNTDYYGVYMPKPWAAAYANTIRRLDGIKECSFFEKYEEDEWGTLRAFRFKTEENEGAVLWSNIYMLPNTTADGRVNKAERIAMPAWESRWSEWETRTFDASGDEVTIIDIMGNRSTLSAHDGKVNIKITGSPIFVYGII